MRKQIFVAILILVYSFLIAEIVSLPSDSYGIKTFDVRFYTGTTSYKKYITLPVDAGYEMAGDIYCYGGEGNSLNIVFDIVSYYDSVQEGWYSASIYPVLGFINDFPVYPGIALSLRLLLEQDVNISGKVENIPAYNLLNYNYYKGLNFIMAPLTRPDLNTSELLGNDIYSCDMVGRLINNPEGVGDYVTCYKEDGIWTGDIFPIQIGDALFVNVLSDVVWPAEEVAKQYKGKRQKNILTINTPMPVYYRLQNASKDDYNLTGKEASSIKFKAWVTGREDEILTESNFGCGLVQIADSISSLFINMGNFNTEWTEGDEVNFLVTEDNAKSSDTALQGTGKLKLNSKGAPIYKGFESTIKGSGEPIIVNTIPLGIENETIPYETALYQNYPNPFNPVTTIRFSLKSDCSVKLNVFNYKGQLVKELVNSDLVKGYHKVDFNASNMSSGLFFYILEADEMKLINKMVLVR